MLNSPPLDGPRGDSVAGVAASVQALSVSLARAEGRLDALESSLGRMHAEMAVAVGELRTGHQDGAASLARLEVALADMRAAEDGKSGFVRVSLLAVGTGTAVAGVIVAALAGL
jgi:hypothetical protein